MKDRKSLKNFSKTEQEFLKTFNRGDIWKLAESFDREIEETKYDAGGTNDSLKNLCESNDGIFNDPSQSEGGSQECNATVSCALAQRSTKYLKELRRRRDIFITNPEIYRKCQECDKIIPIERHLEVPVSSRCVSCKNGN